ncbi:hypothetical protein QUG02_26875 [Bacillus hominis]|uniref:Uncharacterized protein n=1 Tax=Bacillus hominis TaxID=2817478 RepID=A0ABT7RFE3_9BACI|nr:hypothetical protein [Bacillus hominis]MDM5191267.1 hypothetical protein [Bacillus hominis]MDM5436393.1 hypothetical protein [Bacillus hominis]MDM5441666.1 hypothetical protein [Bacillus hominis]
MEKKRIEKKKSSLTASRQVAYDRGTCITEIRPMRKQQKGSEKDGES